jgi:hypothetical protein
MDSKDLKKLTDAGFTVLREYQDYNYGTNKRTNPAIKAKTAERPDWFTFEKGFKTFNDRDRRMQQLLQDPKTVKE